MRRRGDGVKSDFKRKVWQLTRGSFGSPSLTTETKRRKLSDEIAPPLDTTRCFVECSMKAAGAKEGIELQGAEGGLVVSLSNCHQTPTTHLFVAATLSLLPRCTPSLSFKRLISAESAVFSVLACSDAFGACVPKDTERK